MRRLSYRIAGLLCTIAVAGAQSSAQLQQQLQELKQRYAETTRTMEQRIAPLERQIQTQRAAAAARIAVEQASTFGWERYAGSSGRVIGMTTFGASAPLKQLQRKFGFEPEHWVDAARELLRGKASE